MNTVLDLIYRLLAHPTDAMSDVTTGEKMKESSIIWGFVVLLLALSSVEAGSFVTAFLASFVGTGSLLLIHSAVVDYISGLLGGRGTARGITAGFMCASIPYAFSVFFSLSTKFMSAETFSYNIFTSLYRKNLMIFHKNIKTPSCKRTRLILVTTCYTHTLNYSGYMISVNAGSTSCPTAAAFRRKLRSDFHHNSTNTCSHPARLSVTFL